MNAQSKKAKKVKVVEEGETTEKENPTDIGPGITERYNDA